MEPGLLNDAPPTLAAPSAPASLEHIAHDLPVARVALFLYRPGAHGEREYLTVRHADASYEPLIHELTPGASLVDACQRLLARLTHPTPPGDPWPAGPRYGLPLWGSDAARLPGATQASCEVAFAAAAPPREAWHGGDVVDGAPTHWLTACDAVLRLRYPEHVEALLAIDDRLRVTEP